MWKRKIRKKCPWQVNHQSENSFVCHHFANFGFESILREYTKKTRVDVAVKPSFFKNASKAFLCAVVALMLPIYVVAQDLPPPPLQSTAPAQAYTQQQIDQLAAQIALYPDQLVSQILMASTYPLEVVEASRWVQEPSNSPLRGDALAAALAQQPWDPSVKSLVNYPQILSMMNNHLQWTEELGDAFLAQQPAVMDSVQRLRQMAETSGHLTSTPQQTITSDDGAIDIEPTVPQTVYVPYYNPATVYGNWPYPDYEPYYYPYAGYYPAAGVYMGFGVGIGILGGYWGWNHWDWHNHRLDVDDHRFAEINGGHAPLVPGAWSHDIAHRHGVPYNSPTVRSRFQNASNQARQNYRGYTAQSGNLRNTAFTQHASSFAHQANAAPRLANSPARAPSSNTVSHASASHGQAAQRAQSAYHQPTNVFESFSHGSNNVRAQSQRGSYSRSTAPSPRSAPAAPSGGSRGGGGSGDSRERR
jgi:hypothetical protein